MSTMARIMDDLRRMEEANEYLKSQVRTMKEIIQSGEAKPHHCRTCKHFMQHYVKTGMRGYGYEYMEVDCGHCVLRGKGIKNRSNKHATDGICDYYEMGERGVKEIENE